MDLSLGKEYKKSYHFLISQISGILDVTFTEIFGTMFNIGLRNIFMFSFHSLTKTPGKVQRGSRTKIMDFTVSKYVSKREMSSLFTSTLFREAVKKTFFLRLSLRAVHILRNKEWGGAFPIYYSIT